MADKESFRDFRRRMHECGMVVPSSDRVATKVPEEYLSFIDVVSDEVLHYVAKGTAPHAGDMTPETMRRIVDSSSSRVVRGWLATMVMWHGIDYARRVSISKLGKKYNVGQRRLSALYKFRGGKGTYKKPFPQVIRGSFVGTIDGVEVRGKIHGTYVTDRYEREEATHV